MYGLVTLVNAFVFFWYFCSVLASCTKINFVSFSQLSFIMMIILNIMHFYYNFNQYDHALTLESRRPLKYKSIRPWRYQIHETMKITNPWKHEDNKSIKSWKYQIYETIKITNPWDHEKNKSLIIMTINPLC